MSFLDEMRTASVARVVAARAHTPEPALLRRAEEAPEPLPLRLDPRFDVIAELKLRSPALGLLAGTADDVQQRLTAYAEGGAVACSILTEPTRFDGALGHLDTAAALLRPLGVPAMRKDFVVDPYQVIEARALGASGVLLIARFVSRSMLNEMLDCARTLGLFVLLETFDADDLQTARDVHAAHPDTPRLLVGINCRDLSSLAIEPSRFAALAGALPASCIAVAESGVTTPEDAAHVVALGYRVALVGTGLMRQADPRHALAALLTAGRAR